MFKSILFFTSAVFIITGCTNQTYNLHNNFVNFQKNKIYTYEDCANFSFKNSVNSNEYGKLFKEYISLDMSCQWNGFERGFFTDLFKNELKLNSMKNVETLDFTNYEITTHEINEESYVNFIYFYIGNDSEFIIDYDGKLSNELVKKFNPNYKNNYLNKKRFNSNFNSSLVEKNIIKHYFGRTNNSSDDKSK